ncbi:MAG: hypothetical protein BRC31_06195, partial [Actinobacteria bacterium QS_5_72_10]
TAAATPPPVEPQRRWPAVTVVVINLDARDELAACLASVDAQDYPAEHVELIVVDNASTDGSADMVRADFPHARLIENDANAGFAPAVNQAAELAGGAYLALLNNDATAERAWLRAAVDTMENEQAVGCVGSKVLRDDGVTLDYAGGEMAFYGHGFARGSQQPDDGDDRARWSITAITPPSRALAIPASATCWSATPWPRSLRTTATTASPGSCRRRCCWPSPAGWTTTSWTCPTSPSTPTPLRSSRSSCRRCQRPTWPRCATSRGRWTTWRPSARWSRPSADAATAP